MSFTVKALILSVGIFLMVVAVTVWDFIVNPRRFFRDLSQANLPVSGGES